MEKNGPQHHQACSASRTSFSALSLSLPSSHSPLIFSSLRHYSFHFSFLPSAPSPGFWFHKSRDLACPASVLCWSWKLCFPFHEENGYLATASFTCTPLSLLCSAGVNVVLRTLQSFYHRHQFCYKKAIGWGNGGDELFRKLQTKDDRCLQHTKYTYYLSCITKCCHSLGLQIEHKNESWNQRTYACIGK